MTARRGGRTALADGPGSCARRSASSAGTTASDLCTGGVVTIVDDGVRPPTDAVTTPRIGITWAVDQPWRWVVPRSQWSQ